VPGEAKKKWTGPKPGTYRVERQPLTRLAIVTEPMFRPPKVCFYRKGFHQEGPGPGQSDGAEDGQQKEKRNQTAHAGDQERVPVQDLDEQAGHAPQKSAGHHGKGTQQREGETGFHGLPDRAGTTEYVSRWIFQCVFIP
jgi:hypothetical protein